MHEFEAAHMCPTWCAVRPEHMLPDDGERVVMREQRFWVVELAPLKDSPLGGMGVVRGRYAP
jgi:hypothetical protein